MPSPSESILRYFEYGHQVRNDLWEISKLCAELARELNERLPDSAEKTTGLRKLLEAKDCFVRAAL